MLKKILLLAVAAVMLILPACGKTDDNEKEGLAPERELMSYTSYDLQTYLLPFWYTREIYNETVLFVGEEEEAALLYNPSEILSVRNYGLDIEYAEGTDYTIQNGKIKRTANSAIPYFQTDDYYRTSPDTIGIGVDKSKVSLSLSGDRYLKYGEGNTFTFRQIAVTYRHSEKWQGAVPIGQSEKLSNFLTKLKSGQESTVVFYGDSITTGANSSGTGYGGNTAPYADSWTVMIRKYLENTYDADINYVNTAVGGYTTEQGQDGFEGSVIGYSPDLLVLGFGMNNMNTSTGAYKLMIQDMIERFHQALPNSEIILVASMLPNYESNWYGNQELFYQPLEELAGDYDFVAMANVTAMHKSIFETGKRYRDMTGNNINHPNDFVARLYAQTILKTMLGEDYYGQK